MADRQLACYRGKTELISLPEAFFTKVVPKVQNFAELKVVLHVAYLTLRKPAHPRPDIIGVTYKDLRAEAFRLSPELDDQTLRQALSLAVEHRTLVHSTLNINGVLDDVYSLPPETCQPPTINIFSLYEQNVGMITPMIAEELKEAEKTYPAQWIEEAFEEAVLLNKRSWRYIARILERWASEGKASGERRGDTKKDGPDKYIKGRYGYLVRR